MKLVQFVYGSGAKIAINPEMVVKVTEASDSAHAIIYLESKEKEKEKVVVEGTYDEVCHKLQDTLPKRAGAF